MVETIMSKPLSFINESLGQLCPGCAFSGQSITFQEVYRHALSHSVLGQVFYFMKSLSRRFRDRMVPHRTWASEFGQPSLVRLAVAAATISTRADEALF